ncbi:MAG: hypothetical protein LUH09_06215 [Clostridiales bacterium]|nr:hypothetical protein [Clostridiales bacterium]
MRRMIALLLTAVLCLQLCVPAFATETVEEAADVTVANEEELASETSETEEAAEITTDEAEDTSSVAAVETDGTGVDTAAATEESAETEIIDEADDAGVVAEEEETAASEATGEASSDAADEDITLYSGFEADYNDPEFLQLLENGAFEENEDNGISTVATYSHSSQFNGYTITKGVDVSKWNGTINWTKVKASGISFVMIRCGYRGASDGTLYKDSMFETNVEGALAAGLEVGVYVYSQAITTSEAKAEANLALQMCEGYSITLPIVLDYEYYTTTTGRLATASLTKTQRTNICLAFCNTVDAAGYGAMVYANRSMLEDDTYGQQIADAGYEVWLAQWNSSTTYSGTYTYWQYTDSGSVSGISSPSSGVDMNYRYELPSPTITLTYCAAAGVRLAWSGVSLADSYVVYRRASGETAWTKLGTVSSSDEPTWLDETAVEGTTYEYVVRACDGSILSTYQRTGTTVDYEPEFSLASAKQTNSGVQLTWEASSEYDSYQILRRSGYSGSWTSVTTITDVSKTSYVDTTQLTSGTVYSYTIVGISNGTKDDYDTYGLQLTWIGNPELVSVENYKTGMKVTWKAVSGADGYRVYRRENGSWKLLSTIASSSTVSYYDSSASDTGTAYTYTVRAYLNSFLGPYDNAGISGTRITVPTLVSVGVSGSSMKVQWNAVSGATAYYIYRKTSGSSWTRVGTASGSATSYLDSTGSSGTVYFYTVRVAVSGALSWYDESGVSGLYLGTVSLQYATRTDAGIVVSWSALSGASTYAVYRKAGASGDWKRVATVTTTSYTETASLSASVEYYYTVRGLATYGGKTVMGGYETNGIFLTDLATPTLVGVTNASNGLTVKWNSVANATKYYVYRKVSGGSWSRVATVSSGTSWTDTTAESGTVYYCTVCASDGKGSSRYNTAGVSGLWLSAPKITSVSTSSSGVSIKWSAVSGATSYRIYRKTSGGSWKLLASTTKNQYIDTATLNSGTSYYYTVRGCASLNSSTVLGVLASDYSFCYLGVPTLKSVTAVTSGLTVSWNSVTGASCYYVYRKVSGGSWSRVATVSSGTSWTDTTAESGTVYYYTVRAGDGKALSWYHTTGISGLWLETPELTSVAAASAGVKLSWTAVANASGYRVYRKTSGGGWTFLSTVTGTSYTDSSLTSYNTEYYYTVRAYATVNGSTYYGGYDRTGIMLHYLAVPQLSAADSTDAGVVLNWLPVSGATSYLVYRKTSGSGWVRIATLDSGSITSYTDTTGVSGTTYYYTVRAKSANGLSWYNQTGVSALCQ